MQRHTITTTEGGGGADSTIADASRALCLRGLQSEGSGSDGDGDGALQIDMMHYCRVYDGDTLYLVEQEASHAIQLQLADKRQRDGDNRSGGGGGGGARRAAAAAQRHGSSSSGAATAVRFVPADLDVPRQRQPRQLGWPFAEHIVWSNAATAAASTSTAPAAPARAVGPGVGLELEELFADALRYGLTDHARLMFMRQEMASGHRTEQHYVQLRTDRINSHRHRHSSHSRSMMMQQQQQQQDDDQSNLPLLLASLGSCMEASSAALLLPPALPGQVIGPCTSVEQTLRSEPQ